MEIYSFIRAIMVLLCLPVVINGDCQGGPHTPGSPNLFPIDTSEPVFVKSAPNGKLYLAGTGDDSVSVLHLWGSPYDMGYAHGTLQKESVQGMVGQLWDLIETEIKKELNKTAKNIRPWFLDLVAKYGVEAAFELQVLATYEFTGKYFYDELKGLSDASGVSYDILKWIHMLGEITRGRCSMFGSWGNSVSPAGSILQLRALDWTTDGPYQDYPQVTVYHPDDPIQGHAFVNFGWAGWIGSIAGMSSTQLGISEIGVVDPDSTFGKESRFGIPFTYLLRDILQFDKTLADALRRILDVKRTCHLILGVGDGKSGSFRGIEYSATVANFFDDETMMPEANWHPRIKDTVYWSMDWLCPNYNAGMAQQLMTFAGNLTAEGAIRDITAIVQTGDLLTAYYDLSNNIGYLSNARGHNETGPPFAYDRCRGEPIEAGLPYADTAGIKYLNSKNFNFKITIQLSC